MRLVDPLNVLQADRNTTLVLDRRRRHLLQAAVNGGLTLGQTWKVSNSLAGGNIYVGELRPPKGWIYSAERAFLFPRRIDCDHITYVRLVDRFYLPTVPEPAVSGALFDLIAHVYDQLISSEVNLEIARLLLEAVVPPPEIHGSAQLRILDFGCGTGLALCALRDLGNPLANQIELVGTDLSPRMLEFAARRGEEVLKLEEWRQMPVASVDGAISSFVLHYGVPQADSALIAGQLSPGARFAANYFKGDKWSIHNLVGQMCAFGLVLERIEPLQTATDSSNTLVLFIRKV
jgi:SAM-dependent methyltransferase